MSYSAIRNHNYINQTNDFRGLRTGPGGNRYPTDIDGFLDWKNRCFVFMEAKYQGVDMPEGQHYALTRLVDALKKPTILFLCEHNTPSHISVDMATTTVNRYYWRGKWHTQDGRYLKDMIDGFLKKWGGDK